MDDTKALALGSVNRHAIVGTGEPAKLDLVKIYERYRCPAELMIPYRIPPEAQPYFDARESARFMPSLWNMDFPWIATAIFAGVGTAVLGILVLILHIATHGHSIKVLLDIFSAYPILFVAMSPLFYPALVAANLRLGYGKDWMRTLLGPTHIGLTDSGFKLHVRGRLFYNFPNLALWAEIFHCDLVRDLPYRTISLSFLYQSGFGRINITLPLCGFSDVEELRLVLDHFARFVPPDHQSETFKKLAHEGFAPLLDAFSEGKLNGLLDETVLADISGKIPFRNKP